MLSSSLRRLLAGSVALVLGACAHHATKVDCDGLLRPINTVPAQSGPDDAPTKLAVPGDLSRDAGSEDDPHGR